MKKDSARSILQLVNDPIPYEILHKYAKIRIDDLATQLQSAQDFNSVLKLQGAIKELRRVFDLREEVQRDARDGD